MADNQEQGGAGSQTNHSAGEQEANATEPIATESESSGGGGGKSTGDPGRTPGKAEGEDDSSATETG